MGLPSCFLEKKFGKHEKGDDITPFDGTVSKLKLKPSWTGTSLVMQHP
jgi:hypothetical protein